MNVNCDNCTEDFEIKIQEERVKDDVKRMFFTCPHCNEKFVYFYTNTRIETIKKKLNKVKEKGSKVYTNELKEKYYKEFKELQLLIKQEIDKLEEKYKLK